MRKINKSNSTLWPGKVRKTQITRTEWDTDRSCSYRRTGPSEPLDPESWPRSPLICPCPCPGRLWACSSRGFHCPTRWSPLWAELFGLLNAPPDLRPPCIGRGEMKWNHSCSDLIALFVVSAVVLFWLLILWFIFNEKKKFCFSMFVFASSRLRIRVIYF